MHLTTHAALAAEGRGGFHRDREAKQSGDHTVVAALFTNGGWSLGMRDDGIGTDGQGALVEFDIPVRHPSGF